MARRHALVVASILGLVAVLGVVALGRTIGLGAASTRAQDAVVARRAHELDRFEASLRKQLAASEGTPAADSAPALASAAPRAQRVVYVRPKPIIVGRQRAGAEYEHEDGEHEAEGMDD